MAAGACWQPLSAGRWGGADAEAVLQAGLAGKGWHWPAAIVHAAQHRQPSKRRSPAKEKGPAGGVTAAGSSRQAGPGSRLAYSPGQGSWERGPQAHTCSGGSSSRDSQVRTGKREGSGR
jgi:hypothetical protein